MQLTFEQAEAQIPAARKDQLARLVWRNESLPGDLIEAEKVFVFGLYTYAEYEEKEQIKNYFIEE